MVSRIALSIEYVEAEIANYYLWFHEQVPGVTPKEVGRLAQLWRVADALYAQEEE